MESASTKTIIQRTINLLKLDRREIVQVFGFAFISSIISLSLPLGIQSIINIIQSGRTSNAWIILVLIVTIGAALVGSMQAIQLRITENIEQKIFVRSAFEFAYKIPNFKLSALTDKYMPELTNRFFDTLTIQKGLAKLLINISTASLQIAFALFLLTLYHPVFILFTLLLILLFYIIFKMSGKKGLETNLMTSKYKYKTAEWLEDIARTLTTFKLAGKTNMHLSKTDEHVDGYINYREKHFKVLIFQFFNLIAFKVIVVAGLLIIGGLLVIERKINLGQFVASEIIILLIMSNMEKLVVSLETAYDVLTGVEKIRQVADIELENYEGLSAAAINENDGFSVEFDNVSFAYLKKAGDVISNLNLKIDKKAKVCISGFSSSGKSSIMKLVSGINNPYQGKISMNQHEIKSICSQELRHLIGFCFHNETLFNGTIFENITIGREGVGYQDVKWATEKVGLTGMIKTLPDGYETEITPQGKEFSRNTVQKILLARAIVTKPQMLLLEYSFEYFSLSTKSEIISFLTDEAMPWTLIATSNDPAIAKACDEVIVMDKGKVKYRDHFNNIVKLPDVKGLFDA